jgi:TolB-like protein
VLDSPDAIVGPAAAPPRVVATRRRNRWKAWIATALPIVAVAGLFAFALWPTSRVTTPQATATPASAPRAVLIRVPRADSIGPGSGQLATAISAAIETELVRSGMNVLTGTATANPASATLVVQATVQRVGQRARANIRVVAERDSVVWADQMNFRVDSSFVAQDSIAARVVRATRDAVARLNQP